MKRSTLLISLLVILSLTLACAQSFETLESPAATQIPIAYPTIPAYTPRPLNEMNLQDLEGSLVGIFEQVSPGVVAIQTLSVNGGGLGSGFVYDMEGHIITNYHVVEGASDLEVDFPSGIKVRGEVIGSDLDSDIAVIKVDVSPDFLYPLSLGQVEEVRVGQLVMAIGNPYGFKSTMTLGIISATGRTLDSIRESPEGGLYAAGAIIQTDASINPGNSGGPLLNLNGEVIGINRAIKTTGVSQLGEPINSGIGFATSIDIVRRVVPVLIQTGSFDYPYLGISALPELSLMEMEILGLTHPVGAYVVEVVPGSPSARAGIRSGSGATEIAGLNSGGDLIIAVDGRPIQIFGELLSYLMTEKSPGDTVMLTIIRSGEEMNLEVLLEKRP